MTSKPKKNTRKEIKCWAVMLPSRVQPCIVYYTKKRAGQTAKTFDLAVKPCRIILD